MKTLHFLNAEAASKALESLASIKNVDTNSLTITPPNAPGSLSQGLYTLTWSERPLDIFKRLKSKRRA